jgi:hypothetical protein
VLIRIRPNVARTSDTPAGVKRRFRSALSGREGLTHLSFPPPRPLPLSATDDGENPEEGGERPREKGVTKDRPPLDARFDWSDEAADAFLPRTAWFDVSAPLTRAPTVIVMPGME